MARYERRTWTSNLGGVSRSDQRSGEYLTYVPDLLMGRSVALSADSAALLARCEVALARTGAGTATADLDGLAPLLLRTEAAASSWIEGIPPRARQVAFAELSLDEDVKGFSDQALLVANNVHIMRTAVTELAGRVRVAAGDVVALQERLITNSALAGVRTSPNWIGGSSRHPLSAAYVPPPPEHVGRLMDDLATFLNDVSLPPLVQAALVHAQLETVHPFGDGNGRVGRALIHTVLARRGVVSGAVIPVSLVLMTRKDTYIRGLEAFRHVGPRDGADATLAVNAWLDVFLRAVVDAAAQVDVIAGEVEALHRDWRSRLAAHRYQRGLPPSPRSDSAVHVILSGLLAAPVMTNRTAQRLHGVSDSAASAAFAELRAAGITTKRRDRQNVVHTAPDVLDLLDVTERRLASPVFDPDVEPPSRPAPTRGTPPPGGGHPDPWSARALSVWGKTDRDGGGHLPLVHHLEDAAAVAGELWDHWLPESVRAVISAGPPDGDGDGRRLLAWLAGLHDIGKVTPGFAIKALNTPGSADLVTRMADCGLVCPPYVRGVSLPPHCHLGQFVLSEWLTDRYAASGRAAASLTSAVGFHHGSPPGSIELQDYRGNQWTGRRHQAWRDVQSEIIEGMTRRVGATDHLEAWLAHSLSEQAQVLLSGAVVVADWLSSDTLRFPHGDRTPMTQRLAQAGLDEALGGPWRPPTRVLEASELLRQRFPRIAHHGIRPMQEKVLQIAGGLDEPGLIVVEAPMGSGKTEAALMAAEELARRFGCGGVFVALPTMATSDAMFGRVREWTTHLGGDDAPTTFLAHGKARLNEDYRGLVRKSRVRGIYEEDEPEGDGAVVTSWLQGRRKGVLANLVVGTIDQVLFGALKSRHLALRHLALAGKVVVIDEVHAADAYMRRYLVRVLEWLGAYGTPVVLLSATLPSGQLDELTNAYARGRGGGPSRGGERTAYPRITVQTSAREQVTVSWTGPVTEVDVARLSAEDIVERVVTDVEAGGCVVVVRNTVHSAQETYAALRSALGAGRVSLVHSQFVARDRFMKEGRLREMLGPPGEGVQRPNGHVVVGTQVLEQSIDIDADVMVSDHAPVDLVLQRMGRLHRHERGEGQSERPEPMRRARLWLAGAPDPETEPELDGGSRAVYGEALLLRSGAVLAPHLAGLPVRLPTDIDPLVTTAYEPDLAPPAAWAETWEAAEEKADDEVRSSRARARTFRVAEPGRTPSLVGWLDARQKEPAGGDETMAGQAQVRDTEDTLEVLVVWRDGDGVIRLLPGDAEMAGADLGAVGAGPPSPDLALSVLACSVRLPRRIACPYRIDAVIKDLEVAGWEFAGWQESPWLKGQLVLCLDDGLRATLAGQVVRYDHDLGLVVEKEGAADE